MSAALGQATPSRNGPFPLFDRLGALFSQVNNGLCDMFLSARVQPFFPGSVS
jgi:hypothetical protein